MGLLIIGAGCGAGGGSAGSGGQGGAAASGPAQTGGASGGTSQGGNVGAGGLLAPGTGGAAGRPESSGGTGGDGTGGATGGAGASNTGGRGAGGGTAAGGRGGQGGTAAGSGGAPAGSGGAAGTGAPPGCTLPATTSFQRDVQPFLMKSCGSQGGDGCHVIDGVSTMSSGGYDHAYDWITAGAHASSCPEKPTPYRYQVVVAVIEAADPPTCSKSRKMPPTNVTGTALRAPLTACELATLKAWLAEPLVTQMHRADDSSPTTPYPMPPFN
ncbi:MAG TPA: hypothetical protein VHM31_04620 [Polyangia bacterium]|nr:hypothetical protein [Polyangia bacterium]